MTEFQAAHKAKFLAAAKKLYPELHSLHTKLTDLITDPSYASHVVHGNFQVHVLKGKLQGSKTDIELTLSEPRDIENKQGEIIPIGGLGIELLQRANGKTSHITLSRRYENEDRWAFSSNVRYNLPKETDQILNIFRQEGKFIEEEHTNFQKLQLATGKSKGKTTILKTRRPIETFLGKVQQMYPELRHYASLFVADITPTKLEKINAPYHGYWAKGYKLHFEHQGQNGAIHVLKLHGAPTDGKIECANNYFALDITQGANIRDSYTLMRKFKKQPLYSAAYWLQPEEIEELPVIKKAHELAQQFVV